MLKDLKVAELREIAEEYGVDLDGVSNKAGVLAALAEEGVAEDYILNTDGKYKEKVSKPDKTPAPATPNSYSEVLVYMNRANPTFEILGYRFTKDHPYVAMNPDDAQEIFDFDPRGFRIATPRELSEYYS